jgi:hypothetical protein
VKIEESDLEDLVLWPEQISGDHRGLRVVASHETPNSEIVRSSIDPLKAQADLDNSRRINGHALVLQTDAALVITTAVNLHTDDTGAQSYYESFRRDLQDTVGKTRPDGGRTISATEFDSGSIADASFGIVLVDVPPNGPGAPSVVYATLVEARRGSLIDVTIIQQTEDVDVKAEAIRIARLLDENVRLFLKRGPT